MDQWSRTQSPKINPCIYGQLIFFSETRIVFSTNDIEQLDIYMQKGENGPLPYIPYAKINLKWVRDQNLRGKTIKLLEGNLDVNLYGHGLGNNILYTAPKTEVTKEKNFIGLRQN